MGLINRFQDIQAWQKARVLTQEIYSIPKRSDIRVDRDFSSQIQRAVVSIMSNIAEGFGRESPKQFTYFLNINKASAFEVQSLLLVALDQNYISRNQFEALFNLSEEVIALIIGLKRSQNKRLKKT